MMFNVNIKNIPELLTLIPRWVFWKYGKLRDNGKRSKLPLSPMTGRTFTKDAEEKGGEFAFAMKVAKERKAEGVGFLFDEADDIVGIDLDNCIVDGALLPWARDIIMRFKSYTEVSPSGTGFHIYVRGEKPGNKCRKGNVEVYGSHRYFTVTGELHPEFGAMPIRHCQAELSALYEDVFGSEQGNDEAKSKKVTSTPERNEAINADKRLPRLLAEDMQILADNADDPLIKKLFHEGEIDEYRSASEADYSLLGRLALLTKNNAKQMKRMFLNSELARDKHINRKGFLDKEIAKAVKESATIPPPEEVFGDYLPTDDLQTGKTESSSEEHQNKVVDRGEDEAVTANIIKPFTAADLLQEDIEPIRWVVPDLLPVGLALLVGSPKLGKSFMAMQLCGCVAGGHRFLDLLCNKSEVLYLALEDGKARLQQRLKGLCPDQQVADGFYIEIDFPRFGSGGRTALEKLLKDNSNLKLVIVDTWQVLRSMTKPRNLNAYEADYAEVGIIKKLAGKHDCCILLIHHLRKNNGGSDDYLERVSGSMGISGAADTIMLLHHSRGVAEAELNVTGRDIEERTIALYRDHETQGWVGGGVGLASGLGNSPEQQAVLNALQKADEATPKEIAEMTGFALDYSRKSLSKLLNQGKVKKVKHGHYAPVYPTSSSETDQDWFDEMLS